MNRLSRDTPVADIMSSPAITVSPDDTVRHCMELMTNKRIRHLPVVKDRQVLGILSIGDLVKAVIEDQSHQIEELQKYIAG
jgi:CBS domain-containing protein